MLNHSKSKNEVGSTTTKLFHAPFMLYNMWCGVVGMVSPLHNDHPLRNDQKHFIERLAWPSHRGLFEGGSFVRLHHPWLDYTNLFKPDSVE